MKKKRRQKTPVEKVQACILKMLKPSRLNPFDLYASPALWSISEKDIKTAVSNLVDRGVIKFRKDLYIVLVKPKKLKMPSQKEATVGTYSLDVGTETFFSENWDVLRKKIAALPKGTEYSIYQYAGWERIKTVVK